MNYPNKIIELGFSDLIIVRAIKERLQDLGIAVLDIDNPNYGPQTILAVKKFQERNQLKPDGIIGELTWKRLFEGRIIQPVNSLSLPERVYQILHTQLFVREKTGHNDGYEVEQYLKSVGLPAGYSWCQAFQYWGFEKAANDLHVKNPMPKVAGVLNHRDIIKSRGDRGPGKIVRPSEIRPYDIGIMDHHHNYEGHTMMITGVNGSKFTSIEGNTGADPTDREHDREGNGVYERNRLITVLDCAIRYL